MLLGSNEDRQGLQRQIGLCASDCRGIVIAKQARVILAPAPVQKSQGVAQGAGHGHALQWRAGQGQGQGAQGFVQPFPNTFRSVQGMILAHCLKFDCVPVWGQDGAQEQRAEPVQADGIERAAQDHVLVTAHVEGAVVGKESDFNVFCAIGVHHCPDPVPEFDQDFGNIDAVGRKQCLPVHVGQG